MLKQIFSRRGLTAAVCCAALFTAATVQAATTIVTGYLSGTNNWYRTNIYQLNGMVFVRSNGVLNIEAGTVIKGHNLGTFSTNVGALVICRGGKIFAQGTPQNPIIFTADVDDTSFPDDLDIYQRGLWGGVVILGRTTINGALDVAGNAANPRYEVYEGLPDVSVGGEAILRYGGTDDDDNSGVLRYVSIRHGGALLATDKEINGLSLGAVGRGTTIEFVEAYAFADDGFEFFGGTVNTKYLVSAFNDDDTFDVDMGFRGTNQFWFGIQPPDKKNYGMELNNQINEIATASLLTPQADFKVYNMTVIGSGSANTNVNGGRNGAIILRPYAAPKIYNSIFTEFNERAIELETRNGVFSDTSVTNGYAQFRNNLWWNFVRGSGSAVVDNSATNLARFTAATNYWTDTSLSNLIVDPQLGSVSRTNFGATLDPRPKAGSPALNPANVGATPNNGFLTPVNYVGAFGPNDLWIGNWTALAEYGVLTPAAQQTTIVTGYLSGTNNWYRTNIYQLNGMVFVRSNGVLNIEAGTVIKGHNLGTFSTNVGALVICRGGKIFAQGTPQNPIIFTADVDDTSFPDDLDIYQRGLWGGLVILGRTTINGALDVAGNAANPKYEVYEGLPDVSVGGEAILRYGGTDDDDNSGVLRYVSIRHGGALLATDKEINGLSLGAVGRGTTIEFVEAYAFADDGFEFFGGTVNTKYLVSAFNDDDTFDVDMGFRGTNQFWFGIQPPDKKNYGMELNNQINEIATASLLTPQADFKVYNMTVIGSGSANTNVNGGRNGAIILRPYAAPKIYNSIFTEFNERAIELETRNGVFSDTSVTNGYAQFRNNLWWNFVRGSGSAVVDNSATNLARFTAATNYWTDTSLSNLIVDPQLGSVSRTNFGATLDPRPKAGSPALNIANVHPQPGNVVSANYIGAFGNVNWASDWTALAEYSVLTGVGGGNPRTTPTPPAPPLPQVEFTVPHLASTPVAVTNVLGATTFINHGLVGVGHISASALDGFGESFGSMSGMQITGWTTNADGSYSGTLNVLPDRGYNLGAFFADYAARINQVGFTFKPYYGPTNIGGITDLEKLEAQTNQFTFGAISGVKFTYFDPITGSNSFTTGLDPGTNSATLFGQTMPYVTTYTGVQSPSSTVTNTYTGINKLPLDSEALILKGDGSGYVGDEYGANIYYFNPAKQIIGAIVPPQAFQPHLPTNVPYYSSAATPVNGRRNNQGFEGVSLSPDGTRLFALQQSASVQDSDAANNQRAKNTRLLIYDVSSSPTPTAPIEEYALTLPTYKLNGNGGAVDRTCAQSEIVALDNTRFLVLSRDGNGLGNAVTNPNVYKSILLVDTTVGAPSNVAGDAARNVEGGRITIAAGVLDPAITPLSWVEAVNILNTNQLAKFNVLWDSGSNQVTKLTMGEKWEGMALVSANDPANTNDYFLFVGNDNDFITSAGQMRGPDGTIVSYDAFNGYPASRIPAPLDSANSENDTRILAYRVTILPGTAPVAAVPSHLRALNFPPGGPFQLQLTGSDGAAYDIQANTDLLTTNWVNIAVITNTGGMTIYSDFSVTNFNQRFYRAVAR